MLFIVKSAEIQLNHIMVKRATKIAITTNIIIKDLKKNIHLIENDTITITKQLITIKLKLPTIANSLKVNCILLGLGEPNIAHIKFSFSCLSFSAN